jgi:hypothetical protein
VLTTRQRPNDLNPRGETEQRRYTAFARTGRYSSFHDQQLFDLEPAWGALGFTTIGLSGFPADPASRQGQRSRRFLHDLFHLVRCVWDGS